MSSEKTLIRILRGIADLVADEASKNPEFGRRVEELLEGVPSRCKKVRNFAVVSDEALPDLFLEAKARSAENFEAWLAQLEIPVLKALVRKHDLDSSKRTYKWKESVKFAKLIAEQILARLQRGAAFVSSPR